MWDIDFMDWWIEMELTNENVFPWMDYFGQKWVKEKDVLDGLNWYGNLVKICKLMSLDKGKGSH